MNLSWQHDTTSFIHWTFKSWWFRLLWEAHLHATRKTKEQLWKKLLNFPSTLSPTHQLCFCVLGLTCLRLNTGLSLILLAACILLTWLHPRSVWLWKFLLVVPSTPSTSTTANNRERSTFRTLISSRKRECNSSCWHWWTRGCHAHARYPAQNLENAWLSLRSCWNQWITRSLRRNWCCQPFTTLINTWTR